MGGSRVPGVKKVRLSERSVKEIGRLEPKWKERVASALEDLAVNPLLGKKLKGEFEVMRSFRLGQYRIIYRYSQDYLEVADILHRKDAYR